MTDALINAQFIDKRATEVVVAEHIIHIPSAIVNRWKPLRKREVFGTADSASW